MEQHLKIGQVLIFQPRRQTIRRILEVVGWFAVALLVLTGLTAILGRAIFLNAAFSQPVANPAETFDLFEIRYYNHYLATLLHLGQGFNEAVAPSDEMM